NNDFALCVWALLSLFLVGMSLAPIRPGELMPRGGVRGEADGREAHPYSSALLLSGVNHEHLHQGTL
ncbi:MAG TPA: hypothetical protein VGT82_00895, partial [Ktedonobacteraceae bacterium]|nr:hypothetical protein [Ktedonobacteraceae bacterium]